MPGSGRRKLPPREMTRRQLIGSLIAFTVITGAIDTVIGIEWAHYGFSIFRMVGLVFTSIILVSVYRSYLGELLRRRKAQRKDARDTNAA